MWQGPIADAMPRMKHLPGLLPQALPNLLRSAPTLNHGFKVAQQMRPADLPPSGGIPRVRAPAIRDQDAAESLAQQLLRHLGPPRQPDHEDRDACGHRHPQPRAGTPFMPPRLIEMRDRLRADVRLGLGHWGCQCLHGGVLQVGNSAQSHRYPKQVGHDVLRGTFRQVIGPRTQGDDGLHTWTKAPRRHPDGEVGARRSPTGGTYETVQLILGHHWLDRRQVSHLVPLRLAILTVQGVLAARAVRRLDWKDRHHVLQREQGPRLAMVPWLPAGLAATDGAALSRAARRGGITRRRLRGVLRVHPQPLQQPLHRGFQRRNTCFEPTDIGLRFGW